MMYLYDYESPLGTLSLASDGEHLCGLWLEGQKYFQDKIAKRLGAEETEARVEGETAFSQSSGIRLACAWLDDYFQGRDPGPLPPVLLHGTEFQEEVWACLEEIPYGTLTTYGAIAKQVEEKRGRRASARAVGVAVGRNPVSIIVPCHRVVGASGSLTGYAGGIHRKVQLLELEGVDMSTLTMPKHGTAL